MTTGDQPHNTSIGMRLALRHQSSLRPGTPVWLALATSPPAAIVPGILWALEKCSWAEFSRVSHSYLTPVYPRVSRILPPGP